MYSKALNLGVVALCLATLAPISTAFPIDDDELGQNGTADTTTLSALAAQSPVSCADMSATCRFLQPGNGPPLTVAATMVPWAKLIQPCNLLYRKDEPIFCVFGSFCASVSSADGILNKDVLPALEKLVEHGCDKCASVLLDGGKGYLTITESIDLGRKCAIRDGPCKFSNQGHRECPALPPMKASFHYPPPA